VTQVTRRERGAWGIIAAGTANLGDRTRLVVVTLGVLLSALVPVLLVAVTGLAVTAVSVAVRDGAEVDRAMRFGVLLVATAAAGPLLSQLVRHVVARVCLGLVTRLRCQVTQTCQTLSAAQLETATVQDSYRLAEDAVEADVTPSVTSAIGVLTGVISLLTLIGLLGSWSPLVAILAVAAPVPAIIGDIIYGRIGWRVEKARVGRMRFVSYLHEMLSNHRFIPEVRAVKADGELLRLFRGHLAGFLMEDVRVLRGRSLAGFVLTLVATVLTAAAYLLAIRMSLNSRDVGQFVAFMVGASTVQGVCQQLLTSWSALYVHKVRLQALVDFLRLPGERSVHQVLEVRGAPSVEFRNVSFSYPNATEPTLQDVSFVISAGDSVAIVGDNGSGKSTLLKVLIGAYEPSVGSVLFDGRETPTRGGYVLDGCGILFQQPTRFIGTVRDNVSAYRRGESMTDDRIWSILEDLSLSDRVRDHEPGLDTLLGREFDGEELSVGEWQRLAVARALLLQDGLLVLDEPTSSADEEATAVVAAIMKDRDSDMTRIAITHDDAVVNGADRVFRLASGRLVEVAYCQERLGERGPKVELA